jgi:hypothetical protein
VVEPVIHEPVPVPDAVKQIINKEKQSVCIAAEYEQLKQYLLK